VPTPGFPLPLRNALAELAIAAFLEPDARAALDWLASSEGAPGAAPARRLAAVHLIDPGSVTLLAVHAPHARAAAEHAARASRAVASAAPPPPGEPIARAAWMARALWNERLFFEVHEVLEAVWKTAGGAARQALQGVIQIAVAYHHLAHGNVRGARSLLVEGRQRISGVDAELLPGLDLRALHDDTASWEHAFARGEIPSLTPPHLRVGSIRRRL
jgi:hypothetical protein